MAVFIEIPLADYQAFLGRCLFGSREFEILKNFVIDHVPDYLPDGNIAKSLCTREDAKLLLDHAKRFYPVVASCIEEALRSEDEESAVTAHNEYRKAAGGDTWHFQSSCSHWPVENFSIARDISPGPLCNECVVKARQSNSENS